MDQKLIWKLDELYTNSNSFYHEIDEINRELEKVSAFEHAIASSEQLLSLLNRKWEIKERANQILIYGSLTYYKDVDSEETQNRKKLAEQLVSKVDSCLSFIDEKIIELGKEKVEYFLIENKDLSIYQFYLDNLFRKREHIQDAEKTKLIKEYTDEISSTLVEYNQIIHDLNLGIITVDGQKVQVESSNLGKYLSSRNRETRKEAYKSVNKAYQGQRDKLASILNQIYINRVNVSKIEEYKSVLEKNMVEENIDTKILSTLMKQIHKHLDLFHRYLKQKTEALSIHDPHLYDYGVPFDNGIQKKYSLEEAIDIIKKALEPLGKDYLEIIDYLIEHHHIDALLDKRKHQSITFSWSTYSFLNYRETYIDLKNLAHELGHIVNAYMSEQKQPYLYAESTIFVGETASLVNELLLNQYLLSHASSDSEKLFYLSANIENYFTQVFKQTMYTEFESKLYAYVQEKTVLTADLLESVYADLQKQYFGEFTIYDECSSIEWARLGHLYRWNYYIYKYATGLIMTSSVVNAITSQEVGFIDQYLLFLSSGSCDYSLKMLKKLNIDLTEATVINNSLKLLEENINEFQHILLKEKK